MNERVRVETDATVEPPRFAEVMKSPTASSDILALQRDDLAACIAGYRQASGGKGSKPLYALGFGGLGLSLGVLEIGRRFAWSDALALPILAVGFGALVLAWRLAVRRDANLRERFQVTCPLCERDLITSADLWLRRATPADVTVATGRCPHCHGNVF